MKPPGRRSPCSSARCLERRKRRRARAIKEGLRSGFPAFPIFDGFWRHLSGHLKTGFPLAGRSLKGKCVKPRRPLYPRTPASKPSAR